MLASRAEPFCGRHAWCGRMTGKPVPTTASFFVASVLEPLASFQAGLATKLPHADRSAWAHQVCEAVTARYAELATTLLDTVRRDEQARLRLSIKPAAQVNPGGAADHAGQPPPVSDSQKIAVQLMLDVQAYARELERAAVDPSTLPSYATLAEAVRPEEAMVANAARGATPAESGVAQSGAAANSAAEAPPNAPTAPALPDKASAAVETPAPAGLEADDAPPGETA